LVKAKKDKKLEKKSIELKEALIKNAIHITNAFGFNYTTALKVINAGLIGYKTDKQGEQLKGNDGRSIPITISLSSYYVYKEKYSDTPEYYSELRAFAMSGYAKLMVGFQKELSFLHAMAGEIMLNEKEPMNKLHAIDVLVSKVIPTQSAFAEILKEQLEDNPSLMEETKDEPASP